MPDTELIQFEDTQERHKQASAWEILAEKIVQHPTALEHFCELMQTYVGDPNQERRNVAGLPRVFAHRYGQEIEYTSEVCAVISDRGDVLYVRALDRLQQWNGDVQPDYDEQKIFERGKDFYVVSGSLLSQKGPMPTPVARHRTIAASEHSYYRLQVLPEYALNQPYLPIYGDMTFLPFQIKIERTSVNTHVHRIGDTTGRTYRPIDAAFVDMLTTAASDRADALKGMAS